MERYEAYKDSGVEWIGEIPEGWNCCKFKYFHSGTNTGEAIGKELWSDRETDPIFYTAGEKPIHTSYSSFPDWKYTTVSDLLMSRNGTPYVYLPIEKACYTDHIIRVSIVDKIDKRFVRYCLQESISSAAVDTVSITTWSASLWNEQKLPCPLFDVQRQIADYLDSKTAEIDNQISQTQKSIELLQEYRKSVISEAVTKGLDPDVPMKDSGVEWIGEIPEGWFVTKLLYGLECSITDGPHETPVFYDEGIPFISAEAVSCGNGKIDFTHMRGFISREYYDQCCEKYIPRRGDIYVIKSGATTGKAAIVDTDEVFTIWSPLAAIRCDKTKLLPSYVFRFVQSDAFQKQVEDGWTYGTQQNIGMRTLEKVLVCFPSLKEQQAIADYLDSKTAEIDSLIEKKKQLIEKLQEYRKSLISEAVTGKFKVPGV